MALNRGGVVPRPQLAFIYANQNAPSNPAGGQKVMPATSFYAAGIPQPFVFVPPNWQ